MTARAFVDTNVILYSFDPESPHHARSHALMERTRDPDANLWISPQIFCEVFRYVTHPSAARRAILLRRPTNSKRFSPVRDSTFFPCRLT